MKPFSNDDQRKVREAQALGVSYVILRNRGGKGIDSIVCLTCHSESFNKGDIDNQYCGRCYKQHVK